MVTQQTGGVFLGRARVAKQSANGGARHVFAHIKGLKNDLVFVPWGGVLQNPFPGPAKLYAGDAFYIEYDDKAENPKLWCLKTYEVYSASGTELNLVRDGFHHIPFQNDKLMVAPAEIGGTGTSATVLGVAKDTIDGQQVWKLTLDTALTASKGDVLVESDGEKMLLPDVNTWAPCDYDFVYEPVASPTDDDDFENADYALTPVIGITAYTHRMSILPECVKKLNQSKLNGIFSFNALNAL